MTAAASALSRLSWCRRLKTELASAMTVWMSAGRHSPSDRSCSARRYRLPAAAAALWGRGARICRVCAIQACSPRATQRFARWESSVLHDTPAVLLVSLSDGATECGQHASGLSSMYACVLPVTPVMCAGRSSPRRLLLGVDASGYVVLLAANSGHMLMTQQITAGPPLAVNVNSELQRLRHGTQCYCQRLYATPAGCMGAAPPFRVTAAEHDTFSACWLAAATGRWSGLCIHTQSMGQAPDTTALVVCLSLPLCLVCF